MTDLWKKELENTKEIDEVNLATDDKGRCLFQTKITSFGLDELGHFGKEQTPTEEEPNFTDMEFSIVLWACCHLAPCFRSVKEYDIEVVKRTQYVKVTKVITVSDMAFMVLVLENYWELFKAYAGTEYKLLGDAKLKKEAKKTIELTQKAGRVHPVCGGNKLSDKKGTKRYHELVCYIDTVLKKETGVHEKLDEGFTAYCIEQEDASASMEEELPPPLGVAAPEKMDESHSAYYALMQEMLTL